MEQQPAPEKQPAGRQPVPVSLLVLVWLMLLAIIVLSWLWTRDRRALAASQGQLRELAARTDALVAALPELVTGCAAPVDRQKLPRSLADFNGLERQVLELDWADGRRLGFAGGDLILVRERPAATAPVDEAPSTLPAAPPAE